MAVSTVIAMTMARDQARVPCCHHMMLAANSQPKCIDGMPLRG